MRSKSKNWLDIMHVRDSRSLAVCQESGDPLPSRAAVLCVICIQKRRTDGKTHVFEDKKLATPGKHLVSPLSTVQLYQCQI